ncbi:hypothetical protein ACHQM5_003257 [Ranunculus cassubicifolius]
MEDVSSLVARIEFLEKEVQRLQRVTVDQVAAKEVRSQVQEAAACPNTSKEMKADRTVELEVNPTTRITSEPGNEELGSKLDTVAKLCSQFIQDLRLVFQSITTTISDGNEDDLTADINEGI